MVSFATSRTVYSFSSIGPINPHWTPKLILIEPWIIAIRPR